MGGTAEYRLDILQRLQTEALRITAKRKWEVIGEKLISTKELLHQTGQLSVRQLKAYHTLMMVKKIITEKEPEYLYEKLTGKKRHGYETRKNLRGDLEVMNTNYHLAKTSFRWRSEELYNRLPKEIKELKLEKYKGAVKDWVKENIKI